MFATNEDKSLFNLGEWGVMTIERNACVPGITLQDATMAEQLKNKLVRVRSVSDWVFARMVCQGVTEPCPVWDVIHSNGANDYYGVADLTEDEQEDAIKIEAVFFSNDNIYIVANSQPDNTVKIRFKPA